MSLPAVAWGISIAGWILSPIISKLLDRALSYCKTDKQKTLSNLLKNVLPRLVLTLEAVEDMGKRDIFENIVSDLKSAFYDMEDILDEVDYIRRQQQLDAQAKLDKKKKGKFNVYDEAGPSSQDISIEASLTLPGALNKRLKDNMGKIEVFLDAAQSIIPLAKLVKKNKKRKRSGKKVISKYSNSSDPKVKVIGRDKDRNRIVEMLRDTKDDVYSSSSDHWRHVPAFLRYFLLYVAHHLARMWTIAVQQACWLGLCYRPRSATVSDSKCFSAIGIYGISGSGKTTLAQHVCKYEEKEKYFDLVMWVHVSQNYSTRDILKEMFEAASTDKQACPDYSSLDVLEKELEKKLDGKRFLLVLDDIWSDEDGDEQKLENLLSPLNRGKKGSKILATSRNKYAFSDLGPGVAMAPNVFPISDLNGDVFLELFMYYALDITNPDDSDLTELQSIGAEIAPKLKGSPLAARTVGGQLLKTENNVDFWRATVDQDLLNETTGAVWWSYQQLDEQVRRCFSYCSIFPRRYSLDRDELVKLWVAEGFIQTANPEEDLEVVGQRYFDELLATSFMQPGESKYHGGKLWYLVHDLMYDLAEKVAGNDCFRIEKGLRRQVPRDVRYLFVANGEMATEEIFELKNLRTLIIHESGNEVFLQKVFKKLRKLRVLEVKYKYEKIRGRILFKIPPTIGHLKHLRHLSLRLPPNSELILPRTLTKLYHLQVLSFKGYSELEFPPDIDVGNLSNLRHMSIGHRGLIFPNIARLTSLKTLERFGVSIGRGYEIKQLRDLNKLQGHLTIADVGNVKSKNEAHEANLAAKTRLRELKLIWNYQYDGTTSPEVEAEVLEGLCPPRGLKSLEIHEYRGLGYPSWMVGVQNGGPKYLNTLLLGKCYQLGPAPELFERFIHLRELTIWRSCWEYFPDNVKDLKQLKSLTIEICLNLKSLPELPRSLEMFTMVDCERGFTESCNQVNHPNWQKLQHVKSWLVYHSDDL